LVLSTFPGQVHPGAPTEAQGITEWPLNLTPLPDTGNDQWTLTLT